MGHGPIHQFGSLGEEEEDHRGSPRENRRKEVPIGSCELFLSVGAQDKHRAVAGGAAGVPEA